MRQSIRALRKPPKTIGTVRPPVVRRPWRSHWMLTTCQPQDVDQKFDSIHRQSIVSSYIRRKTHSIWDFAGNLSNCIAAHTRKKNGFFAEFFRTTPFQKITECFCCLQFDALTSGKSNFIVSFSVCLCVRTIPKMLTDKFTRTMYITNVVANSIKAIQSRVGGNDAEIKRIFVCRSVLNVAMVSVWLLTFWIVHFCHSIDGIEHFDTLTGWSHLVWCRVRFDSLGLFSFQPIH